MAIKPEQMTSYDDASKEVEKAVAIVEAINVGRFNSEDVKKLHDVLVSMKQLRHELFRESHDAFLRARGLK